MDDSIERFLDQQVESPAMAVVRKLSTTDQQPSWEDRLALARWFAFQEFRTPLHRGGIEDLAEKLIMKTMQMMARMPGALEDALEKLKEQGKSYDVTAEELRKGVQEDAFKIRVNPVLSLEAMTIAEEFVPILAEMKWTLVTAADGIPFITSDHPVLRVDRDEGSPYRYGLASSTIELGLPLNQKKYLRISHDLDRERRWLELEDAGRNEEAKQLRQSLPQMDAVTLDQPDTWALKESIIRSSPRFIFCSDEDGRYSEFLARKPWTLRMI